MKAAVMEQGRETPRYMEFMEPVAEEGCEVVSVRASALSHLTRGRASGGHYSAEGGVLASVVGADGVGVTEDGRRVYFALPEAPFGGMAERTLVRRERCIAVPDGLDDVTAAAIANPGMSGWSALAERARMQRGETVLVHGATGTSGRLAVQIAKSMGASKVIATGRDARALEEVRGIGADVVIPFVPGETDGAFEDALIEQVGLGVDVVVDYLWGRSAATVMRAIAKGAEDTRPVRFVHVGGVSGEDVQMPGAVLRSSPIVLMGSGMKSVPLERLLAAVGGVFDAVVPGGLRIATKALPLADVEAGWKDEGRERVVFLVGAGLL